MEMLLEQLDFTQKYDYTLVLTKKNKSPICVLSEAYARTLNVKMDDINSLTFTVPYYVEDEIKHQQIKNPNYDYVIEENMVLLKAGDASNPYFEVYFIIKGIDEETDKLSKSVRCSSREVMLNKDNITLDGSELQLKKDNVNISNGVFDVMESKTTWKAGYIDTSAKVEPPSIGNVNRYRWFDALSKPWLQFLREDVQSAFNCVLFYDTKNKLINAYNRDSYGSHTGIILTEENYIKNLKKKTNSENIVTKLYVSGRDEATFESINPLGTDYVLNYDYFKSNGQMSTELVNALNRYDILINGKNIEFQNILSQINDLNSQLTIKQTEMSTLNEELKALRILQSQYMANGDNVNLPTATTNVNNKVAQIRQKQNEINAINSQIDTLNTQKSAISSAIDKNNATDSQGKIFNNYLLDELSDFTYAESWSNNYYNSTQLKQLYNAGIEKLKDWSVPPIEFEVDSVDLFGAMETQHWWDKIKLGDLVRFYSERLNINTDVRIVEYTYNIDSNDLKFTFSNKDKKLDDTRSIANTTRKANDSSKILNVKKLEWNDIKNTKNAVDTFLSNSLDVARQNVIASQGYNKFSLDENGEFIIDTRDNNRQLILTAGQLVITKDGLQTVKTAVNADGIAAKMLTGLITITKDLYVVNQGGTFSITENGFELKDENYKTLISAKGVVSSDNVNFLDSVDSVNPLIMDIYIDDNVNVIDKVLLKLSVLDYRAYSKSASSGGAVSTTSASGGGSTVTSSSGGDHSHCFALYGGTTESVTERQFISKATSDFGGASRTVAFKTGDIGDLYTFNVSTTHSHSITINSHTHGFSLPNHQHDLVYGIYSRAKVLGNMDIIVDGVTRTSVSSEKNIIDLTQYITTKGWHQIMITSLDLNRLSASLYIKSYIGA